MTIELDFIDPVVVCFFVLYLLYLMFSNQISYFQDMEAIKLHQSCSVLFFFLFNLYLRYLLCLISNFLLTRYGNSFNSNRLSLIYYLQIKELDCNALLF